MPPAPAQAPAGSDLDPSSFPVQSKAAKPAPVVTSTQPAGQSGTGELDPGKFPVQGTGKTGTGTKKPLEGSALSRFGSHLYDSTIGAVGDAASATVQNFSDQGFLGGVGETAMGFLGVRPSVEHLQKATAARKAGDWSGWLSNMIRAIPVAGPIGEKLGTQLQEGDVAGTAGDVVGAAVPFAVGKAAKFIPPSLPKAASKIPLTLAERGSKIPGVQYAQSLAERTIPGSVVFKKFRERQQVALRQMGDQAAAKISTLGGSASEVGDLVQSAIDAGSDTLKDHANELYDAIDEKTKTSVKRTRTAGTAPSTAGIVDPITGRPAQVPTTGFDKTQVGGVQPYTKTLKQVAAPLLRRLNEQEQLMDPALLSSYRQTLEKIIKAPAQLSFRAFQDVRSDLLKIVRSTDDPVPGKKAGLAKRLAAVTDKAMMDAAEKSGIPDLPWMVREANGAWSDLKETYNSSFFKKLGKASPEAITAIMQRASVDDLDLLKKGISRPVFEAASARVLRDVLEGATEPPPTIGAGVLNQGAHLLTQGGTTTSTPVIQGHQIHNALRKMGAARAEALFGTQGASSLMEIADLAEKVQSSKSGGMIPGLLAGGVNATVLSPLFRPGMTSLQLSAGAGATFYTLAKVLTRQPGRVAYRNLVRGLATGNRTLALAAGQQVTRLLAQTAKTDPDSGEPDATSPEPAGVTGPGSGAAGAGRATPAGSGPR